jgi:polyisoprenoid-binding protein YceI
MSFQRRSFGIARGTACAIVLALSVRAAPSRAQVATILPAGTPSTNGLQRYQVDADHSSLEFRVGFMGLSSVHGDFTTYEGTMMYDPQHAERTTVTIAILAESIDTGVAARDRDLRSPNFFDAKKYPSIVFSSTGVTPQAGGGLNVAGDLSMHGVTKAVTLKLAAIHPLTKDAWQNQRLGFAGKTSVNRKAFGIDGVAFWNNEFDPGRRAIADQVDIDVTLEAELVNMDTRDYPKAQALIARIDAEGLAAVTASLKRAAPGDNKSDGYPAFRAMIVNAAAKLRQKGRFTDGAGLYRVITSIDGQDAEAFAGLGELEFFAGERQLAVADFKRSIEADSTNTMALEYLRHLSR